MYIIHVRELSRVLATGDSLIHTTHASKKKAVKKVAKKAVKKVAKKTAKKVAKKKR